MFKEKILQTLKSAKQHLEPEYRTPKSASLWQHDTGFGSKDDFVVSERMGTGYQ